MEQATALLEPESAAYSPALGELVDYLDHLGGPADLAELSYELTRLKLTCRDVETWLRFSSRGYARNLVKAGEWYYLLVLCWKNGQRSPIHDHRGSACAVRVLRGMLTETRFGFAPNGMVLALSSADHAPGTVIASQDADMHQVSNLQAGDADLVTLHVYSPPLIHMGTYSLTDNLRGIEPMFVEFCEADGI
jgi:cysteine dioxygenase